MMSRLSATTGISALLGGARLSSSTQAQAAATTESKDPTKVTFDLLVIGGGSGGIACGKEIWCMHICLWVIVCMCVYVSLHMYTCIGIIMHVYIYVSIITILL